MSLTQPCTATPTDLSQLDASVDSLLKIIPSKPYLQTIPQDEPRFHHHSRTSADTWLRDTPFQASEHPSTQYQTFFFTKHGRNCIHLRVTSQMDVSAPEKTVSHQESAVNTNAVKKKLTLADYKNKRKSPPDASREGEPSPKRQRYVCQSYSYDREADGNRESELMPVDLAQGSDDVGVAATIAETAAERHVETAAHTVEALPRPLSPIHIPLPTCLSPLSIPAPLSAARTASLPEPPPDSPSPPPSALPSPLSPTLPPAIIAALQERAHNAQTISSSEGSQSPCETRLVILKIPKRLRQDYRRLVQLPPKPHARPVAHKVVKISPKVNKMAGQGLFQPAQHKSQPFTGNSVMASLVSSGKLSPPDNARASPISGSKNPATPISARHDTPTKTQQPNKNSAQPGPHKASTRPALSRANSVMTPASASSIRTSQVQKQSPMAAPAGKTRASEAWNAERERFHRLAKSLKVQARQHCDAQADDTLSDKRLVKELAALTNIESLIAFILSFHCMEQSYAEREPPVRLTDIKNTWRSLHSFWQHVDSITVAWPVLHSLVQSLGQVYLSRIISALGDLATGHGLSSEKEKQSTATNAGRLVRGGPEELEAVSMLAQTLSTKGLDLHTISAHFPKTLARATSSSNSPSSAETAGTRPSEQPGKLGTGSLSVPIGLQSQILPAVRAACAMLEEYVPVEGGTFISRLATELSTTK